MNNEKLTKTMFPDAPIENIRRWLFCNTDLSCVGSDRGKCLEKQKNKQCPHMD